VRGLECAPAALLGALLGPCEGITHGLERALLRGGAGVHGFRPMLLEVALSRGLILLYIGTAGSYRAKKEACSRLTLLLNTNFPGPHGWSTTTATAPSWGWGVVIEGPDRRSMTCAEGILQSKLHGQCGDGPRAKAGRLWLIDGAAPDYWGPSDHLPHVVDDAQGHSLYFSWAAIPTNRRLAHPEDRNQQFWP